MIPYCVTCAAVTAMDVLNLFLLGGGGDLLSVAELLKYDLARSLMASGLRTNLGPIDIGGRIGAVWFLPAVFIAGLIVQLLLKYVEQTKQRYLISILFAVFACALAWSIWLPFSILSGMMAAPVVMLGYDLRRKGILEKLSLCQIAVCAAIFAVGALFKITPVYYEIATMKNYVFSMPCAMASTVCVIYIAQKLEKCRPLEWVGKNSMYYLCIHLFELETMGVWFERALRLLHIPDNMWSRLRIKLIFITAVTAGILWMKRLAARMGKKPAVDYPKEMSQ